MKEDKIITIVGLGVVGGSYAIALSKKGYTVYGVNRSRQSIEDAIAAKAIRDGAETPEKFFPLSDIIIIALYPDQIVSYLEKYGKYIKKGCLISDVAGIKSKFVEAIAANVPESCEFLFCHPMAGREKRGFKYADDKVLQGANFLIVSTPTTSSQAIERMSRLVTDIGFGRIRNSDDENSETASYIGDSYRDLTRIANINEDLWSELFFGNKDNLISTITRFENQLAEIKRAIADDDCQSLKAMFIKSSQRRLALEKKKQD